MTDEGLQDEILTAEEVAKYFKLHVKTVARLAKEGRLPGVKIGKAWRFRRSAVVNMFCGLSKEAGAKNE